jgi:hypothetical protein
MADPRGGVSASNEFYSLAAVNKWLAEFGPQPQWKPFAPEPEWTPPSQDQRDESYFRWQQARAVMADTVEAMRVNGKIAGKRAPVPSQIDDPAKRNAAMENLTAMNQSGPLSKEKSQ